RVWSGDRPGAAAAELLSAYMAYRPRPGHTDAQRNLISNIHARGVTHAAAAQRILALGDKMRLVQARCIAMKEGRASRSRRNTPGSAEVSAARGLVAVIFRLVAVILPLSVVVGFRRPPP